MKSFVKFLALAAILSGILAWWHRSSFPEISMPANMPTHFIRDGSSPYTVIVDPDATTAEKHAARELINYLEKITGVTLPLQEGGTAKAAIYVGPSAESRKNGIDESLLDAESWIIQTSGPNLFLTGGRPRGTVYAVSHFLEKELGVRWWNPWEESVPRRKEIRFTKVTRSGKPAFFYRDIFTTYADDDGRFAARNRLNRQGSSPIAAEFGGGIEFGPPYFCHTFYHYIPPKEYFEKHPEWFALVNGKRQQKEAQLCLTSPELRSVFLEKLKANIASSQAEAARKKLSPPTLFAVDQNDYDNYCQCPDCSAIARREGSDAGPILDFVNWLGERIEAEHPDVSLVTFAYMQSEKPPKEIRPRRNVYVRLTDTTSSLIHPNDHPFNRDFFNKLEAWAAKSDSLLIWDYGVTYSEKTKSLRHATGVPLPTLHTFQRDYQLMAAHHVKGIMVEHEFPILADFRDLKLWMMCKLLENPFQDTDALLRDFTDGFYRKAGKHIREYLAFLEESALRSGNFIEWFAPIHHHGYLNLDFFLRGHAIFDAAEATVNGNPETISRLHQARLGLDRATLVRQRTLLEEWLKRSPENSFENFPINGAAVAHRMKATWHHAARDRKSRYKSESLDQCDRLFEAALRFHHTPVPKQFQAYPRESIIHITPDEMRDYHGSPAMVRDTAAPYGWVMRWEATPEQIKAYTSEKEGGTFMPCGAYDIGSKQSLLSTSIPPNAVTAPGYQWYRIGSARFSSRDGYIYAMRNWCLQADLETIDPRKTYDIWLCAKFEGPGFPVASPTGNTIISVDRFVLAESGLSAD